MPKPQFVLRRSLEERRQLLQQHSSCRSGNRMAELAGGTTAEVAAVCCCFPCAVVDFMVLTMYKVPAGLCRNAMRRRRHRRLMVHRNSNGGGRSESSRIEDELLMHPAVVAAAERFMTPMAEDKDVVALENEMWEKFSERGFWRSPSRKE
uniref:uncharacterized protein LOC122609087 n=1 Tax=Erigeron canadensis TaxID=72917 RepID=UPI001CB8D91E|nr:uncharacterized protein LOC122609087 [Erigeron canadensis]